MQKFFVDATGSYLGSYDGPSSGMPDAFRSATPVPFPPDDATQKWDRQSGGYLSAPPKPYTIAKTTPWLRMTQEEARIMDGVMTETDAQMRQVYNAAQYLSSDDQFWGTLHQLIADNLGVARADELLAPEG